MFYTYVLKSIKDGKYYLGYTVDLKKRYKEHCSGQVLSTKSRRPLVLVYYEACLNKEDAKRREVYLKSGVGKKYLKNRLKSFTSNNTEAFGVSPKVDSLIQ